jgi:putative flavoprotein involved in K+ transport
MDVTSTIVIGGGQAGLAMSYCLRSRNIDHVVLERGRVGERWRTERWDSLRLLTPSWQTRLPGWRYQGPDPEGFMTMPDVVRHLEGYARSFEAPVLEGTTVSRVERVRDRYRVTTDRGTWQAPTVVLATGECGTPHIPEMAARVPDDVVQLVPTRYRNPAGLPRGGVLVVGASASGIQLADEIHRSGRPVTLCVGRHTRLPRRYRGRDIMWWLDRMGILDESAEDVHDLERSRAQPSLQLVGRPDHATLDLGILQDRGVRLVGRARDIAGTRVSLTDDLAHTIAAADDKLARLLARIEDFAATGTVARVAPAEPMSTIIPAPAPDHIDLRAEGISTVLWATGFRPHHPWLDVPVLDARGAVRHRGGVTPAPGLYVLGLRFLRRRKSNFIDGVGADASDLATSIAVHLSHRNTVAA